MEKIKLIVGYDEREAVAYHAFCQSVIETASIPLQITPLVQKSITGYTETHSDGSNTFVYSRFLCPYLMDYTGWAIYADGDMICNQDIRELWHLKNEKYAVQVVKHEYKTKFRKKYFSSENSDYPRKNWSSLILWNCAHEANKSLTPDLIMRSSGSFLHRFSWLPDELIGDLPLEWNWLACEYPENYAAKLVHYTLGTPCFKDYQKSEMSECWRDAYQRTIRGMND